MALPPQDNRLLTTRARLRLSRGDKVGALADIDAAAALATRGALETMTLVGLYERIGLAPRAQPLIDPVIALHREDSHYPALLNARSWNRALTNSDLDAALKDINTAIHKAGAGASYLDTRALVQLRRKAYLDAIADDTAAPLFIRGLARLASGDAPGGRNDIAAARKVQPHIDRYYAPYGLTAPADTGQPTDRIATHNGEDQDE